MQGLSLTKNTTKTERKKKQVHFQEEYGNNNNKHVGLFPLKHLWELQPSNKNTQALKSALHRSRGPNPEEQIRAEKYNICLLHVVATGAPDPERFL